MSALLHREHPWIGREVEDTATGRRGVLRAIAPDLNGTRALAWLRPATGGMEWTTNPSALDNPAPVTADSHPREAR
ncbi:hypothetical protein [Streptomyces sp. NPDC020597]|uniref:hypothetical protein n=1 Tax=unclassified Streptomyces TaxID=2593676 RepID=UPI0037AB22A8